MRATRSSSRRRWLPRWTLRLRLTLLYGVLFLLAGTVLLAITYGLVARSSGSRAAVGDLVVTRPGAQRVVPGPPALPPSLKGQGVFFNTQTATGGASLTQLRDYAGQVRVTFRRLTSAQAAQLREVQAKAKARLVQEHSMQMAALLTKSGIALGIMAMLSIGLGWLMAGRALRPIRTMGARAKGISERNLHERLALEGPNDEFKELADTFDGLLERLQAAFESQRRFVANASHELRTPITLERTLVEVALADPRASVDSLRDTCGRVLAATEQQERLIEALLTLARSQRGLDSREEVDLADAVQEVLQSVSPSGIRVEVELDDAPTTGDPRLVERLIANLVENALHYNVDDGWVSVRTGVRDGRSVLVVSNSGPLIDPSRVDELIEPFRRLNGDRPGHTRGLGLGLSIVSAIAAAHGAELIATPRPGGGLDVEARFPVPARPLVSLH